MKCLKTLIDQLKESLFSWIRFIIDENGIVITNNHVVANAEDILVRVGEKEYDAKIIGADPYMDIAVIKMKTNDKFKPVTFRTLARQELVIGLLQ